MDFELRMVQAAVEAQLFGRRSRPVQVGRYTVQGPIGSGGMGSVVRAYDPELQREVALKLLRAERMGDADTRARLVQEARAMAKLSHPNVAMVFEVGEADGHLYVAMELVDGRDLRAWLDEQPRPWREVLPLFEQAGRGLAAAHAKGLIHRDFKPDNVVVDEDGRARVVDFGLAREQGVATSDTEDERPEGSALEGVSASELTTTGTLLGTPAYMSPEQWSGETVDARSDQFSFCVSLWEALLGARPFPQQQIGPLMQAVTEGRITEPRSAPAVPGRILRALRRGLRPDPGERFEDMEALLTALHPPRRTGWIVAGGTVAVVAVATAGVLAKEPSPSEACQGEQERLAGVWDEAAREAAHEGLRATALPYVEPVWRSVSSRLDRYAEDWASQAEASCVGSLARTEAATARHARQQRCLGQALQALDELGESLAKADETVAVDAAHATTRLPDLGACADDRRLARWADEESSSPEAVQKIRDALARARRSLAALDTRAGGMRYVVELEQARAAASEAHQIASEAGHGPLRAEAALTQGRLWLKLGDKHQAEQALAEAIEGAEASGDALTRARASILQVYVLGTDRDRTAEAVGLGEQAMAQLDGLGERPLLRARLSSNLATAAARAREPDHERALALHREAIELLRTELGEDHPHMISAQLNLGRALIYARQAEAAEAVLREALTRAETVWGEDHPHTARVWGTLGTALSALGREDEAEQALTRSLRARERSLGPEHPEVASAEFNLASALRRADRHAEAVQHLRRGLAIRRSRTDEDDTERADLIPWLYMIGDSEVARGEHAAAQQVLREALSLAETDGASPVDFAKVRFGLARALAPDDPVQARIVAEAARDAFRAEGQPETAERVETFLQTLADGSTDGSTPETRQRPEPEPN